MTNSAVQQTSSSDVSHSTGRETIVVAGEFEVGKSSVINAILRRPFLPNDPGFISRPLVRIRHGALDQVAAELIDGAALEVSSLDSVVERDDISALTINTPMPGLEAVEIIEVPFHPSSGFKSEHVELMHQANLFVWVTIASQAWRLSEKTIVQALPEGMSTRSVLAISRSDKLRSPVDLDKIETRLQREAVGHFSEIVFMQASVNRLDACHESEQQWEETGGLALVEIARDIIGDTSVSDEALLNAFDTPKPINDVSEVSPETHSEIVQDVSEGQTESLDRFESWGGPQQAEEHALQEEAPSSLDRQHSSDSSAALSTEMTKDEEYALSLEELLQEVESDDNTVEPTSAGPMVGHENLADPSRAGSVASTAELDDAVNLLRDRPAETTPSPAEPDLATSEVQLDEAFASIESEVETTPREPEIPAVETEADKLDRAIASVKGLETAGVVNLNDRQLQICFMEKRIAAKQCRQAFSDLIECKIEMMKFAEGGDFQETSITIGDWVILLQICDNRTDQFAFFVLERHQTNSAISSVQTKRLLKVWEESVGGDETSSTDERHTQIA